MIDFVIALGIATAYATLVLSLSDATSGIGKILFTIAIFPLTPILLLFYVAGMFINHGPHFIACPSCKNESMIRVGRVRANPPLPLLALCKQCGSRFERLRGGQWREITDARFDRWFRDETLAHEHGECGRYHD